VNTARILIPDEYLDGYLATNRPEGVPDALHALLADGEAGEEGMRRRVVFDVPTDLLPALAEVAYGHFMAWGNEQDRRKHSIARSERETLAHRARAAFAVYNQARPSGLRVRSAESPGSAAKEPGM
jgi:hypothetical protein